MTRRHKQKELLGKRKRKLRFFPDLSNDLKIIIILPITVKIVNMYWKHLLCIRHHSHFILIEIPGKLMRCMLSPF